MAARIHEASCSIKFHITKFWTITRASDILTTTKKREKNNIESLATNKNVSIAYLTVMADICNKHAHSAIDQQLWRRCRHIDRYRVLGNAA